MEATPDMTSTSAHSNAVGTANTWPLLLAVVSSATNAALRTSRRGVVYTYIHTVARGGGTRARAQCVHSSRIDPHHDGVNVCLSLSTLGVPCASRNLHYTALAAIGQTTTPDTGTACHTRSTQPLRDGITIQNASMLPAPSRLRPPPRKTESVLYHELVRVPG